MIAELAWLPTRATWDGELTAAALVDDERGRWAALMRLANCRIDFVQTGKLDRVVQRLFKSGLPVELGLKPVRIALLGSSTLKHLVPGVRIAGLRRGIWLEVYEGEYSQYLQDLMNTGSLLHEFQPQFVCFSLDARHLLELSGGSAEVALDGLRRCWRLAQEGFRCTVIQQKALPVFADLLGNNEYRLVDSPQTFVHRLNGLLESAAEVAGVNLLAVDKYAAVDGVRAWHDTALWHRSKQEVHPAVSPLYGDYLVRMVSAQLGRSAKCLVLDLDNTLWGGVIGDDGLEGIVLGQGNAVGESYLAFQRYVLRLKDRGVILAVCSKNDESNALLPFEKHTEMLLKRNDIACFVANWTDKAANLREIARTLNIGLDSLVFVDDNPFERNLVRQELPEVTVPELPDDPAFYVECVAAGGYFESLGVTDEDRERSKQYQANLQREGLRESTTDMTSYLQAMSMELLWAPFDEMGLQRIVQLINKTNQFNLTTKRYSEAEVRDVMRDRRVMTWQARLKDRFGDNGIIAILIGRLSGQDEFAIDTWLMSCRVLGRQVEDACLNLIVDGARKLGARRLVGEYCPTAKNGMVSNLFERLGFCAVESGEGGITRWSLDLTAFRELETQIAILEVTRAGA